MRPNNSSKYEALKALQPSYVYLCFGINDCGIAKMMHKEN